MNKKELIQEIKNRLDARSKFHRFSLADIGLIINTAIAAFLDEASKHNSFTIKGIVSISIEKINRDSYYDINTKETVPLKTRYRFKAVFGKSAKDAIQKD